MARRIEMEKFLEELRNEFQQDTTLLTQTPIILYFHLVDIQAVDTHRPKPPKAASQPSKDSSKILLSTTTGMLGASGEIIAPMSPILPLSPQLPPNNRSRDSSSKPNNLSNSLSVTKEGIADLAMANLDLGPSAVVGDDAVVPRVH
ncbi:hypothetical protein BC936DRAFT_142078 [Jimgerdemannia flammicorona]|uniref:Uncharacterized protein n=1 Tax=Jimgerdemannia flammicorona TaxID=994334 RepID=A0A433DFL1_9FUNG|nr:hypothetical protein BC936DRAFT_142078 [Jimgerdemannia flammicorona]